MVKLAKQPSPLWRRAASNDARQKGREQMASQGTTITWTQSLETALDEARRLKRHVLLDFTAAPL